MKKMVKTILVAFALGATLSGFAIYYLQEKFELFSEKNTVTAFQVGVYKTKENAEKISKEYPDSILIQDGDYYRIYVGVAKDKNCEDLLENYFLKQNMNVYPKIIEVTKDYYNEIEFYEKNASKENEEVYKKLNGEMLKKLAGEILWPLRW